MCLCGGFCFIVLSCLVLSCRVVPCCVVSCRVVSCCVVLCCAVGRSEVLYVLCCCALWYDTDITETYLFRISSDIIAMAAKFKDNKLHKKVKIVFKNLEVIRRFSLTFVFTSLRPSS